MRATVSLVVACIWLTRASSARAVPFDLRWSAPEGCPSREQIIAASRARLGETESGAAPELVVHGTVTVDQQAFVVDLRVEDAAGVELGERHIRFVEHSCQAIEDSTAVLVGMMIAVARPPDPVREPVSEAEPEHGPLLGPGKEPASKAASERRPSPVPTPSRKAMRPTMTLSASGVASVGLLPNAGFGGSLRWTATLSQRIVVGIEGSFETSLPVPAASGELTFHLGDAGALLGFRMARSRWLELVPLLGARGGAIAVSTNGVHSTQDATILFGAVSAGVLGRIELGHALYLEVLPDIRIPLSRDTFRVRESGMLVEVHRPAPVGTRLSFGLGWQFY